MGTTTTLIGILLLAIFVIPIGYIVVKQFSNKKQKLNLLQTQGKQYNCQFTDYEFVNGAILALDTQKKVFLGVSQHQTKSVVFPLSQVRKVQTLIEKQGEKGKIARIQLLFVTKDNQETIVSLYDAKKDNILQEKEYEHISHNWVQKITSLVE